MFGLIIVITILAESCQPWTLASFKCCHSDRFRFCIQRVAMTLMRSTGPAFRGRWSTLCLSVCGCYSRTFQPQCVLRGMCFAHCHLSLVILRAILSPHFWNDHARRLWVQPPPCSFFCTFLMFASKMYTYVNISSNHWFSLKTAVFTKVPKLTLVFSLKKSLIASILFLHEEKTKELILC